MSMVKLADVCRIRYGKDHKRLESGDVPVFGSGGVMRYVAEKIYDGPSVLIPRKGTLGNLFFSEGPFWTVDTLFWTEINESRVLPRYLYYALKNRDLASLNIGTAVPSLSVDVLNEVELRLPGMAEQATVTCLLGSLDAKVSLNNQINGYLAAICETISSELCQDIDGELKELCSLVTDKSDCKNAILETYVSTESLLPGKSGRQLSGSVPTTGKVSVFKSGDTLVSNIRPYFKKIWYASEDGTCSSDVLVFRAFNPDEAPYLNACLRQDRFFDYVMRGAKGTKMPRGDKKQIMGFPIARSCDAGDLTVLSGLVKQMTRNEIESHRLTELRDVLLPKLMSGEIDVSRVDLTQLNSHLSGC